MDLYQETYLPDILHDIAMGLLAPTMVVIILLILASVFFLGQLVVEFVSERRHFKQNMPAIVNDLNDADWGDITDVIEKSQLLAYQKRALTTVSRNMGLPEEPLFALAQAEVNGCERHYQRRLAWTDTISKVAPMLGLMGTLIPLGPGIVALGQGNTLALSQSLLLAFDATVCGLVCAVFALVVSKLRSGWYAEYLNALESIMSCVIDKAASARALGVGLPANYRGLVAGQGAAKAGKQRRVKPPMPQAGKPLAGKPQMPPGNSLQANMPPAGKPLTPPAGKPLTPQAGKQQTAKTQMLPSQERGVHGTQLQE
ncbi:MAG: MotA/TolQ/ExbB proton channel family protein [Coriobacteriaceae bacterium]|jgi:biopolymer transport protein ExbB/TolQ|nr:MotA/TolQ/ExbB proton channel family protein [Coriobacteriaceae bacterium]